MAFLFIINDVIVNVGGNVITNNTYKNQKHFKRMIRIGKLLFYVTKYYLHLYVLLWFLCHK